MRAPALILAAIVAASPALANDRIALAFQVEQESKIERSTKPVRAVIERQIDAVREANADAAFASVAPKLKAHFTTGENYLRFFKTQFPGLASGRIITFGDLRETSFGYTQAVRVSDGQGVPWLAFFLMDEVNGDWRIANVVVVRMPSVEV
jgi:hypothetical protein